MEVAGEEIHTTMTGLDGHPEGTGTLDETKEESTESTAAGDSFILEDNTIDHPTKSCEGM